VLRAAAASAREADVPAVDALLRGGFLAEDEFYRALAAELGLPFVAGFTPGPGVRYPESVQAGLVPLGLGSAPHRFAIAPSGTQIAGLLARRGRIAPGLAVTTPTTLRDAVLIACALPIADAASLGLARAEPAFSFRGGLTGGQICAFAAALFVLVAAFWLAPEVSTVLFGTGSGLLFLGMIILRLDAVRTQVPVAPRVPPRRWHDRELPVYTVIVPLYRERRVFDRLLAALARFDYPKAKLDIKIVIEADDTEMREALRERAVPAHVEVLVAPPGQPRTKPRALNVALPLARGELTVIYDAEDVPAPDQLRLAVDAFARGGPEVGCLQGRLVIDNSADGWLTRLFTIEYAALFDVINPGLAAAGLPVPLGGTTTHFRTPVLRAARGWDPWNVTEDADLGVRLALLGWRIMDLPSSTLEEAPAELRAWMRQRTRWMKGFMQTCITHSRRPVFCLRRLGLVGFAGALTMTFGTVVSALFYPVLAVSAVTALAGGALSRIGPPLDALGWGVGLVTLTAGAVAMLVPPAEALRRRRWWGLLPFVPLMPLYYVLVSVAAWRALIELAHRPSRWNKTDHGLARTSRSGLLLGADPADHVSSVVRTNAQAGTFHPLGMGETSREREPGRVLPASVAEPPGS
jgi:hypothetical protein